MGTPNRQSILSNIKTTLEYITVAHGYKSTVSTVEMVIRDWGDVSASKRPWIGFIPMQQTFDYLPCGYIRCEIPILIGAHVSSTTKANVETALENLHDDIVAALNLDTTRGGYATMTTIKDYSDDIGDPDSVDSNGVGGTLQMNASIIYQRTIGAS